MTSNYWQKILPLIACNDTNLAMCFWKWSGFWILWEGRIDWLRLSIEQSGIWERGPVGIKNAKFVILNLLGANYWQITNPIVNATKVLLSTVIITFEKEASFWKQSHFACLPLSEMSGPSMDEQLMTFVNILGVITFSSIVLYHFITATPKDAELWGVLTSPVTDCNS